MMVSLSIEESRRQWESRKRCITSLPFPVVFVCPPLVDLSSVSTSPTLAPELLLPPVPFLGPVLQELLPKDDQQLLQKFFNKELAGEDERARLKEEILSSGLLKRTTAN